MHRFVSNKNQSNEWQVVAAVAEAAELTVTPLLALGQRGGRRRGGRFLHTRVGIKHGDKANGHDLKLGCREGQIEPKRSSEGSRCETRHLRQARHSGNVSGKRERERERERNRQTDREACVWCVSVCLSHSFNAHVPLCSVLCYGSGGRGGRGK